MRLFISWSGERSQAFADALHQWLPMVLHYVDPWLSQSDIAAGERWASEVAKELEASKFGIICITRENIMAPWILFEAGALAKSMQEGRVIPLLLDLEFKDITGPLSQFQAKKVGRDGLRDVINSINQFSETKVPETRLPTQFETLWPVLEKKVGEIPKNPTPAKQNRPQHEILEELVASIRGLDMRFRDTLEEPPDSRRRKRRLSPMLITEFAHFSEMSEDGPHSPLRLLVLASLLKDDVPWLYELAVDVYRETVHRSPRAKTARKRMLTALKALKRGPWFEMLESKDMHMVFHEIEHYLLKMVKVENDSSRRQTTLASKETSSIVVRRKIPPSNKENEAP